MMEEYKALEQWYKDHKGRLNKSLKQKRIRQIQEKFNTEVLPYLQTSRYDYFPQIQLNNAKLLSYRLLQF